jgi:methionyl-tRNA formyltransferase
MRVALFGYSQFTCHCARALQQQGHRLELFCPGSDQVFLEHYGLAALDLPIHWFEGMNGPTLPEVLDTFQPDLILSIIFNHRLPESVTRKARSAALNVHPAPLPDVRTAAVWFWPLRLGLTQSEVCIHHITPEVDQGPVVMRFPFRMYPKETQGTLTRRLNTLAPKVMQSLNSLLENDPTPEGEAQGTGTRYPPLREEDLWLDFSESMESLRDWVRACTPYHAAQAHFRGEVIAVHELGDADESLPANCSLGELAVNEGLWVCCGDGMVPVNIVAVPGEGVFSGERFAELFSIQSGELLTTR